MRYISPASLFGETLQQPLDKKAVQLERKKLFAEMELSGEDGIKIREAYFTRSDIINYCEELQKENIGHYHLAIGEDRTLQVFLENAWIEWNARFMENDLYTNGDFIGWVSPWFFSSFTTLVEACFKQANETALSAILDNRLLMTDNDLEQSWTFIGKRLNNNIAFLNHYHTQNKRLEGEVALESIAHLMDGPYIRMIRLLPEKRFRELRDKYAFVIMQASVYTFNNAIKKRGWVRECMDEAELLAVSPAMKNSIVAKQEEMNKINRKRQRRLIFRWVWISVIIIRILMTFFT